MPCPVCWQQATVFDKQGCGICRTLFVGKLFKFQFIAPFKSAQPGNDPLCHSERSRTLCGEVEESVFFTLF